MGRFPAYIVLTCSSPYKCEGLGRIEEFSLAEDILAKLSMISPNPAIGLLSGSKDNIPGAEYQVDEPKSWFPSAR